MMTSYGPVSLQDKPAHPSLQGGHCGADYLAQLFADDGLTRSVGGALRLRRRSDCLPQAVAMAQRRSPAFVKSHGSTASQDMSGHAALPALPFLKELFISPHPDDICYSCFGTAIQGEGPPSTSNAGRLIVTVFSKSRCANGHLGEKLNRNVDDITDVRRHEDERFATSVGCKLLQLGQPDSSARDEFSRKEELAMQTKSEQAAATRAHPAYAAVQQSLWGVIRWAVRCRANIYIPLGIGCHIDHLITRVAAEAILDDICRESPRQQLPVRVTYYEDLPYAFYQTEDTIEHMAATVIVGKAQTHLVPLDQAQWTRKTAAVQGYETQMKPTILPSLLTRAVALAADECHTEEQGVQLRERIWVIGPGEWRTSA